jgi:(1->4)-alpha-D-glucan 1-alpha-D-glucosylmutase
MTVARTPGGMRTPLATYRLQLNADFTLGDAADVVPYLAALGVSDVYASPVLVPSPGASHGYHVIDPEHIDPALGGSDGVARLASALDRHGLGLLLDIVPNHLAAHPANPWWRDVLTHGPSAQWARAFDIDWTAGGGRVILPLLGGPLDEVLQRGEIAVEVGDGDEAEVVYYDTRLPVAPPTRERAVRLATLGDASPDDLRALLDRQHYDLRYWRTGAEELNYRRFFDITDLVGVRVEDPDVFDARHERLLELIEERIVTGLRVDHIDGLRDPLGYLQRLREAACRAADSDDFYIVVEKILEGDEPLPSDWPVAGTTGYELLNAVNAVLVDRNGLARLAGAYREETGLGVPVADIVHTRKLDVLTTLFRGEVGGLVRGLLALAEHVPEAPALDPEALRDALVAVTASFPVYRTYIREDGLVSAEDRARLEEASTAVRQRHPEIDGGALVFIERVLSVDVPVGTAAEVRRRWLDLVLRWQQLTGPAMAKGFEDTTFYVHNRLLALNEVGVDPRGMEGPHGVEGFHLRVGDRAAAWPMTLNATSTHDTKRSDDVRARLTVLSEIPDVWVGAFSAWRDRSAPARTDLGDHTAPDRNEEWAILQLLLGIWPVGPVDRDEIRRRLQTAVEKSAREAKEWTSWLDQDDAHESALRRYVDAVMSDESALAIVQDLVGRTELAGTVNALAQTVVRSAAPGVPDIYQGTELWDRSLVDPDNRRPVDFPRRKRMLDGLRAGWEDDPLETVRHARTEWRDGRLKLLVTWRALQARRAHPELFLRGRYLPLPVTGRHADRVLAFAREHDGARAVVVVPRLCLPLVETGDGWPLGEVWEETTVQVPDGVGAGRDQLTGRRLEVAEPLRLAELLRHLPVALLAPV